MALTSVYSIRIDSRVRKMIDEMNDQNWQEEIRALIEQSVKKKRKEHLLARAREGHRTLPAGTPAADSIREDRDAR
jgi:predicted secreted protein